MSDDKQPREPGEGARRVQMNLAVPEPVRQRFQALCEQYRDETGEEELSFAEFFSVLVEEQAADMAMDSQARADWRSAAGRMRFHLKGLERLVHDAYMSASEGRQEAEEAAAEAKHAQGRAEQRAEALQGERDEVRKLLRQAEDKQKQALDEQKAAHDAEIERYETRMGKLEAEAAVASELREQRNRLQDEVATLQDQLNEANRRAQGLADQLDEARLARDTAEQRAHEAEQQVTVYSERLVAAQDQARELRADNKDLRAQAGELRQQVGGLEAELKTANALVKEYAEGGRRRRTPRKSGKTKASSA